MRDGFVSLVVGVFCLLGCASLIYLGAPAYELTILEQEPDKESMAAAVESYSPSEIDVVPFAALSEGERTALEGAVQSSGRSYTDRGASDEGETFEYRNDIVNQYFVRYDGSLYLVSVVIDQNPVLLGSGLLAGILGAPLFFLGVWSYRTD